MHSHVFLWVSVASRLLERINTCYVLALPHKYLDFLCVQLHHISESWFMVCLFSCLLPCSVSDVDSASWGLNTLPGPLTEQSIISVARLPARLLATLMRPSQQWNSCVFTPRPSGYFFNSSNLSGASHLYERFQQLQPWLQKSWDAVWNETVHNHFQMDCGGRQILYVPEHMCKIVCFTKWWTLFHPCLWWLSLSRMPLSYLIMGPSPSANKPVYLWNVRSPRHDVVKTKFNCGHNVAIMCTRNTNSWPQNTNNKIILISFLDSWVSKSSAPSLEPAIAYLMSLKWASYSVLINILSSC